MKLHEAVANYVDHKQAMGMRFRTEARTLKSFCRSIGDVAMAEVTSDATRNFLAGTGPVTSFWARKHSALTGLYRFVIARGWADQSPLPAVVPKPAQPFAAHIYSHEELRRLLAAIPDNDHPHCRIDPDTYRTLLLLLYGAGLRVGEALALNCSDVDLTENVLTICESKFYKTRLVPFGADLEQILRRHVTRNQTRHAAPEMPFLLSRIGKAITIQNAELAFVRLRVRADVVCKNGDSRHQPRLHDLRHSYAVHRLVSWYQSGADVQRLLPKLATYLGHVHICGTQRYLTLTPELLREASRRFESYAMETIHG